MTGRNIARYMRVQKLEEPLKERPMFRAEEIGRLDRSYFNIILAEEYDVTLQSKNTGYIWYIHNPEYPGEGECIIFHKHRASQPYHQHGRARSLGQAVKSIKGHDVFEMNGRK